MIRYIPSVTQAFPACNLIKAPVTFDANGIPSGMGPFIRYSLSGCPTVALPLPPPPGPTAFQGGDIAANLVDGILYGSASTPPGMFFTLDLKALQPPPATNAIRILQPAGPFGLQIGWSCDYKSE